MGRMMGFQYLGPVVHLAYPFLGEGCSLKKAQCPLDAGETDAIRLVIVNFGLKPVPHLSLYEPE